MIKKSKIRLYVLISVITLCSILLGYKYFINSFDEYYSSYYCNASLSVAIENKTFVRKVKVLPSEINWIGRNITVRDAWIEQQSQIKYHLLFSKERILMDGYNLKIRVDNPSLFESFDGPKFVIENQEYRMAVCGQGNERVLSSNLVNIDKKEFRASIVKNLKDVRNNDIRIILQP